MNYLSRIQSASVEKTFVNALLTGATETGKTSSVVHGAPKPLLVIDLEKGGSLSQLAKSNKFDVFKVNHHSDILGLAYELTQLQQQGQELPYKSIMLDSGTVLYSQIKNSWIRELGKKKLEPTEYDLPKRDFYDIITLLKDLDTHFFVTAHASDNYLKGSFMQIDAADPIKPDCEKRLIHEMDAHYIFKKVGKNGRKAELKKSRILDAEGNNLLPPTIEKFDNKTIIPLIIEYANKDKGYEVEKPVIQNVIKTDSELSNMIDEIIYLANEQLKLSPQDASEIVNKATDGKTNNPYELDKESAQKVLSEFHAMLGETQEEQGS